MAAPSTPTLTGLRHKPLPALHLDQDFGFLKNYLPEDEEEPQHGTKHKKPATPLDEPEKERQVSFAAMSPIKDDHNDKRQRRVPWTHTEDVTILALHRHYGTNWDQIAAQLPGRTADAVRNRCFRLQKQHPMASSEEGRHALDGFVLATHGIAPPSPNKLAHSSNASSVGVVSAATAPPPVKADTNRQTWSAEEDQIIEEGVARFGCKWREIAKALPGRTDSSIRNRWMRLQKDKFKNRSAERLLAAGGSPAPATPARTEIAAAAEPPLAAFATPAGVEAAPSPVDGLAPGEPIPLGLDSPFVMVNVDEFAALAFEVAAEGEDAATGGVVDDDAQEFAELEALLEDAQGDKSASVVLEGPNHAAPPGVKLASAFLATFAALSIGALARGAKQ